MKFGFPVQSIMRALPFPVICCLLISTVDARGHCESRYRPWKECLDTIERCESGYCVLQLWFVITIALISIVLILAFIGFSLAMYESVLRGVLMGTILLMIGVLGIILTGIYFAYT